MFSQKEIFETFYVVFIIKIWQLFCKFSDVTDFRLYTEDDQSICNYPLTRMNFTFKSSWFYFRYGENQKTLEYKDNVQTQVMTLNNPKNTKRKLAQFCYLSTVIWDSKSYLL